MHAFGPSTDDLTSARPNRKFWAVAAMAAFLMLLSWVRAPLVHRINWWLLHRDAEAFAGWWVYTLSRGCLTAWLAWTIWRFPVPPVRATSGGTRKTKAEPTFDPLMGLRALACMIVMFGHYFIVVFPFSAHSYGYLLRVLLQNPPWAGVWVFFTLSGYLMGLGFFRSRYALNSAGVREFLRNRALRIIPVYYVVVILLSIWRYPGYLQPRNCWMLLEILLFDYDGTLPLENVGSLWSITTEVQFYLLAPALAWMLAAASRRLGRAFPIAILCVLGAGTLVRALLDFGNGNSMIRYGYAPLVPNLFLFVTGMAVALLPLPRKPLRLIQRSGGWFMLLLATGIVVLNILGTKLAFARGITMGRYWVWAPLPAVLLTALFIYLTRLRGAFPFGVGLRATLLRAVQGMGVLTYCIYVLHSDIFLAKAGIVTTSRTLWQSVSLFPQEIAYVFLAASLLYFAVERPFELRKHVRGVQPPAAPDKRRHVGGGHERESPALRV